MPPVKTYKTKDGSTYDIPEDKAQSFLEKFPDAQEIKTFVDNAKDTFDLPLDKVEAFKAKYPNAKPLYDDTPQGGADIFGQSAQLQEKATQDPAQPVPTTPYQPKNSDKIKLLAPELYNSISNAQQLANENTVEGVKNPTQIDTNAAADEKTGITGALKDVDRFADNLVGKHSETGYIGTDGQPLTSFKVGDILSVPKDKKLGDGNMYPSGFIQLTEGANGVKSWRGVSAPDPTFQVAKQPLQDVVVTGYSKKKPGTEGYTPDLVDGQTDNTDDYNHMIDILRKPDSKIDDSEYFDGVSKLGASPEVTQALNNNFTSEGAKKLPWWLMKNKEVLPAYSQIIKDHPTLNSTSDGSFKALQDAVVSTYDLDKPSLVPLESGSPAFYEMLNRSKGLQPQLDKLNVIKASFEKETDPSKKEELGKKYNQLYAGAQAEKNELADYFNKPAIKQIIDRADKQGKGYSALSQVDRLFPNRDKNEEDKFQKQHEDLSTIQKILNPIRSIYYGAKTGVNDLVNLTGQKISAMGGWDGNELRQRQRADDTNKENAAANDYVKQYDSSTLSGDIGNFLNGLGNMTGNVAISIPFGGESTVAKVGTSFLFGATAAQNTIEEYRKQGLSEGTANTAGLISGAAMALATWGLGGKTDMEGFKPSFDATQMLLDPSTKEEGARLLAKEIFNYKGNKFLQSIGSSTKSAAEMKLANIIDSGVNGFTNNKYGTNLNTDSGSVGDFLSNVLSFNIAHHVMGVFNEGEFTKEKKEALVNYAATGNIKAAMDGIDSLLSDPNADKAQLLKNKATLEDFAGLNFPKDISPEQKTLLYGEYEKKRTFQEAADNTDFPDYYKGKVKEIDKRINEILANPEAVKTEVKETVAPIMEKVKEATSNPLGLPKKDLKSTIDESEYKDFIDNGNVSEERLNDIAEKVKNQSPLSAREKEIFTDKTSQINKLITENKIPETAMVASNPTVPENRTVEPEKDVTIGEMLDKPSTYKGQNGTLAQDGQTIIFRTNDGKKEYELGNINEIKDSPTSDFGLTHEQSVVSVNDDNDLTVRGTVYKNLFSNQLAAINRDSDGNVISVNLETADGQKRTFKKGIAEDLAYQLHLQEISKNNESRKQFENYVNDEPATRDEVNAGRLSKTPEESTIEDNAPVRRIAKEETRPAINETPAINEPITEDHLRDAKYNVEVARRKLEKAETALSKTHSTQSGMFDATQKGMFAASADEAKSTLEPLRNDYKTAKAGLEEMQRKFDVQSKASNPDIFDNTQVVRKPTQKGADAKATYAQIEKMDEPTSADEAALHYLATGGKVAESSINDVLGSTRRAALNTGKQEAKTSEVKARDYAAKDGKTIDEISHSLWEGLPEHLQDKISTENLHNSLEEHIAAHNTRFSAATELKSKYIEKVAEKQIPAKEMEVLGKDELALLHDKIASLSEEHTNELVNIINHYTNSDGVVDWERLKKDSNNFDSDLILSYNLNEIIHGLIQEGQQPESGGRTDASSENGSQQKNEKPKNNESYSGRKNSRRQSVELGEPNEEDLDQALTQQANSGRIPIKPIKGETPRRTSDVMKDLADGFSQRIIFSKSGSRNAAGSYNTGDTGIKLSFGADLDVTAHEIGHALDDRKGILSNPSYIIKAELKPFEQYGSTPPKGHPKPDAYRLAEGFAEFVRAYVVNPDAAKKAAPETFKIFDNALTDKERKAIEKYSNDVRVLSGSNGLDRIIAQMDEEKKPNNPLKQIADNLKKKEGYHITWADNLQANLTNPFKAFDKAVDFAKGLQGIDELVPKNDPILLSRLLLGYNGRFDAFMNDGIEDASGKLIKDNKGNSKTLKWMLQNLDTSSEGAAKKEMKMAEAYMIAERTIELSKRFDREHILTGIGGGLFSDVQAAGDAVKAFKSLPQEQQDRLQKTIDRYREMADHSLQYMVDKGRMSQETYDQVKADNLQYVAMKRVMESGVNEEIAPFKPLTNGGLGSKKEVVQKVTGSAKEIVSPFVSLVDNMYRIYRESDRNEIMKSFRDLLVNNRGMNDGEPKNFGTIGIKVPEANAATLPIFIKGKVEHWQFEPHLKKALTGLDGVYKSLPKAITILPSTLRWMVTNFPAFAARNFVRDLQDRLIKSTNSGITDLVGDKQHWIDVAKRGGLNSGQYFSDRASYQGLLNESIKELSKNKNVIIGNPLKVASQLMHGYSKMLEKSETVNRVAEYRGSYEKAKQKGMDDFNAQLYAAGQARSTTVDFAILGNYMRVINSIIPFSNASVQGLRTDAKRFLARPATFTARLAIYSVIPQVALWFLNHNNKEDGDEYESLPDYQRDLYWNFKLGDNKWLSVPKPYELSLPAATVDRMLSKVVYGKEDAYQGFDATVVRNLVPLDETAFAGPLKTVVEIMTNKDLYRNKAIIPPYESNLDLTLRKTGNASRLGKFLQEVVGLDARYADYFIENSFAGFGKSALSLSDLGRADSRHSFSVNDLGFTKNSPAYNSKDVQNMLDYAKRYGLGTRMKDFSNQLEAYFSADSEFQKDIQARKLVEVAKKILEKWIKNDTGGKKVTKRLQEVDDQ